MLQVNKQSTISSQDVHDTVATSSQEKKEQKHEAAAGLVQKDHNGNMCLLCGKPLPERVNKTYTEFRTDCGKISSPTGPSADILKSPVAKLTQTGADGVETN